MKENCTNCKKGGHTEEYCQTNRFESFKQNQIKGFQSNYSEPLRQQLTAGASRLEDHEVLVLNQHQWKQKEIEREVMSRLASYKEFGNQVHQKSVGLQDVNITLASVNSNNSEISRVMEKNNRDKPAHGTTTSQTTKGTTSTTDVSRTVK